MSPETIQTLSMAAPFLGVLFAMLVIGLLYFFTEALPNWKQRRRMRQRNEG